MTTSTPFSSLSRFLLASSQAIKIAPSRLIHALKLPTKYKFIKANNMRNSKTNCEFSFDTFLVWRVLLFHWINLYSIDIICQKLMQLSRVWGWTFPYASIWNWRYCILSSFSGEHRPNESTTSGVFLTNFLRGVWKCGKTLSVWYIF